MKRVSISVMVIILIAVLAAGCSDAVSKVGEKVGEKVSDKVTEAIGDVSSPKEYKELDEETYIELYAQYIYLTSVYAEKAEDKDAASKAQLTIEYTTKLKALLDEFSVSNEIFTEYGDKLVADMEDDPNAYMQFMKKIEARVEELKSGK